MSKIQKTQEVLTLVVTAASAIVALYKIWNKIAPEVKKVVLPVMEECKKVIKDNDELQDVADELELELKSLTSK